MGFTPRSPNTTGGKEVIRADSSDSLSLQFEAAPFEAALFATASVAIAQSSPATPFDLRAA
jgi:hypothetical protein